MIPRERNLFLAPYSLTEMRQLSTLKPIRNREELLIVDAYLDYEATEKAEAQIDAFVEKRSREKSDEQKITDLWAETDMRERAKRRRENKQAWREYELHLERVHMGLALEHRARAEKLAGEEVA